MLPTGYAVIHDVPASWSTYLEQVEVLAGTVPDGLLLHIAGPTDEGIRLIDVWRSRRDWERFRDHELHSFLRDFERLPAVQPTVRDLNVKHLFLAATQNVILLAFICLMVVRPGS